MKLVSEALREKFGDIYFEVIFQDDLHRSSCLRRKSDNAVLSFHIVIFNKAGIETLGKIHERIVAGELLGEVIKESGVSNEWKISERVRVKIPTSLINLFATAQNYCSTEIIEYKVKGVEYAQVYEFYNPEFTAVVSKEDNSISARSSAAIAKLEKSTY